MTQYRNQLPQLSNRPFLADGGLETCLIFHDGIDLSHFASFTLLKSEGGKEAMRRYFRNYLDIATASGTGFLLDTPTWRASQDWGDKLDYSPEDLVEANKAGVELVSELRGEYAFSGHPIVINGAVGPRGDGYVPGEIMTVDEAQTFHSAQIDTFAGTNADMITGTTITNTPEAIGIVRAAKAAGIPSAISFTVETDGKLPTGQTLGEAIEEVDAATDAAPAYYMINCAHTDHFEHVLGGSETWVGRIKGVRANASRMSHAELDNAEELDDGDPVEFGQLYRDLLDKLVNANIFGGCCGTDHRHVQRIFQSIRPIESLAF
ncbi:MAG: homocysteine S-methyltransferase [Rhodospirillaceae bacterium]|nr:homocysteine S-methyltransferase [Rhodospirillaceae bacterium]